MQRAQTEAVHFLLEVLILVGPDILRELILGGFSTIFNKGDIVCEIVFTLLQTSFLLKMRLL